MTAEEIARLRALCEAATPGPWFVATVDPDWVSHAYGQVCPHNGSEEYMVADTHDSTEEGDAAFIAAARTALPQLLDELERLRADAILLKGSYESCVATWLEVTKERDAARAALKEAQAERDAFIADYSEWRGKEKEWLAEKAKLRAALEERFNNHVKPADVEAMRADLDAMRAAWKVMQEEHATACDWHEGLRCDCGLHARQAKARKVLDGE